VAVTTRGIALRDMTNVVETVNTEATVTVMTETETEVEGTGRGEVGATTDVVTVVEVEETEMMEDILLDMTATDAVTTAAHAMMSMLCLVQVEELLVRMRHHGVEVIGVDEAKEEMEWEHQKEGPQLLRVLYLCLSESARLPAGTSMHLVTSNILLSRPNKPVSLLIFFPVLSLTDVFRPL
jgi:hypothetical protein